MDDVTGRQIRSQGSEAVALSDGASEVSEAEVAIERLSILNAIIEITAAADSVELVMIGIVEAICSRYQGLAGAVGLGADGELTVISEIAPNGPVDWDAVFAAQPDADLPGEAMFSVLDDAIALVLDVPSGDGARRRVAFFDADRVVPLPREVLAQVAVESRYVLSREIAAQQLKYRDAQFRAVFYASPVAQALMENDSRDFAIVNDALCTLVGYSAEELVGRSARSITFPDDIAGIEAARDAARRDPGGQYRVERRMIHASGEIIFTETTLTWIHFHSGERMLLQQITDISAQRRAEAELLESAETDSLTGLPNRLRVVREITEIGHENVPFGVLFLDIDSFKSINEARGHDIGDEVLIDVAGRLADIASDTCLVGRFGGDEFVIVCRTGSNRPGGPPISVRMGELAKRVQRALTAPVMTSLGAIHVTASIGLCDDTVAVAQPLDRLQYADTAAYQAKRMGEDRHVVYDARLHNQSVEFGRIEALLRTALDENRLVVHYQPIVDVGDGYPVGVEALIRMEDSDGSLIMPGEFISVAERSGLIVPMGTWVLREATRTIAEMGRTRGIPGRVSINIAARQAARPGLVEAVLDALTEAAMEPSALTLELTESALLEADSDTLRRLYGLRERGVQIALDDFGTGYSSLSYLRKLPVSRIKVDRSFVADMTTDAGSAAIVKAVTSLAADLGLSWVAEGVETPAQWRALKALGPGMAQGYYFSTPEPAARLHDVMRSLIASTGP